VNLLVRSLDVINSIEAHAESLTLAKEDLRRTFFLKVVECLNSFFFSHLGAALANRIDAGRIRLQVQPGCDRPEHFEKILCLDRQPWKANFMASVNRHLLIDSWAVFEACNAGIGYAVLDKAVLDNLELDKFMAIHKIITQAGLAVDANVNERLKRKLRMAHIPIPRLFFAIVKGGGSSYTRDCQKDMEFLSLYGRLRNSMHANFVYRGQDIETVWRNVAFRFENGRFPWFSCREDEFPALLINMVEELTRIFDAMVGVVEHDELIQDPMEDEACQIVVDEAREQT